MNRTATVSLLLFIASTPALASEATTYDVVQASAKCGVDKLKQLTCDYKIGKGLWIAIPAIGTNDVAVTIFKSDWDKDYYATFALMHQCVVIKPGKEGPTSLSWQNNMAFISPKNGKVYRDWASCQSAE